MLTYGTEGHKLVLPGVDAGVVRPVAPHVGGAVDQPGGVEDQGVPQQGRHKVGHPKGLSPHVPGHHHGQHEAHEHHRRLVVPGGPGSKKQAVREE